MKIPRAARAARGIAFRSGHFFLAGSGLGGGEAGEAALAGGGAAFSGGGSRFGEADSPFPGALARGAAESPSFLRSSSL